MSRYRSGRQYKHQYGNLIVTTWSERGMYYVTVLDPSTGYEVTIETVENNPIGASRAAIMALERGQYREDRPDWNEAIDMLGEEARLAMLEIDEIVAEEDEAELSGGRQQIECNFECPGLPIQQAVWPRKGEITMDDTCTRYLRERRGMDEYQISMCKKGNHKRLY